MDIATKRTVIRVRLDRARDDLETASELLIVHDAERFVTRLESYLRQEGATQ